MSRIRAYIVGLGLLAGVLNGCSLSSSTSPIGQPKAGRPSSQIGADLLDPRSPTSTVVAFWHAVQQGSLPVALAYYEPRVVNGVGLGLVAGALAGAQPIAATSKLNPVAVTGAVGGRIVIAEALPKLGVKSVYSFYLQHLGGRWQLDYDTFVANAIQTYAQQQAALTSLSRPRRITVQGLKAGLDAVATYRQIALAKVPFASGPPSPGAQTRGH